jgi:hypothetical protein
MKKLIAISITTILLLMNTSQVFAADIDLKQVFMPQRDGIPFNGEGLTYPSFNNFTDNPKIGNALFNSSPPYEQWTSGDERVFTTVKHQCRDGGTTCCQEGDSTTPVCKYYDTIGVNNVTEIPGSKNLEVGDILRFRIYFHNNGSDMYDSNTKKNSLDARTVKVGIDVSDISNLPSDPEPNIIRPEGFISSVDNTYIINGQLVDNQTATDDTQAFYTPNLENVSLDIVPNSAWLIMDTDGNEATPAEINQYILEPTGIEFDTDKEINAGGDDVNVIPIYEESKAWLQFDILPGCFHYSGFATFDVEVVGEEPPNYCESLSLTGPGGGEISPFCALDPKTTIFNIDLEFADQPEDFPQYVRLTSTDGNAEVFISGTTEEGETDNLPLTITIDDPNEDIIEGIYYGLGTLDAQHVDIDGNPIITEVVIAGMSTSETEEITCHDSVYTCNNGCEDICITHPLTIPEGSYSTFSANSFNYYNDPWQDEILYMVDNGHGEFYETLNGPDSLLEAHPEAYPNPFGYELCENVTLFNVVPLVFEIISNAFASEPAPEDGDKTRIIDTYEFRTDSRAVPPPAYNDDTEAPSDNSRSTDTTGDFRQNNVLIALDFSAVPAGPATTPAYDTQTNDIEVGISGLDLSTGDPTGEEEALTVYENDPGFSIPNIDVCNDPEDAFKADQGEQVYFYAEKAGTNVITVEAECTDEENCEEKFSILGVACQDLSISSDNTCIDENTPNGFEITNIEFVTTDGTFTVPNEYTKTHWYSTPSTDGFFFALNDNGDPIAQGENPLVDTTYKKIQYTGKKQPVTAMVSKLGPLDIGFFAQCKKTYEPCADAPPVCQDLSFDVYSATSGAKIEANSESLSVNGKYFIQSYVTYDPANPTYSTDFKLKHNDYGRLYESMENPAFPGIYFPIQATAATEITSVPLNKRIFFFPSENSGLPPATYQEALKITATGSSLDHEPDCTKSVALIIPEPNACEFITLQLETIAPPGGEPPSTLLYIEGQTSGYTGNFQFTVTGEGVHLSEDPIVVPDPNLQTLTVDLDTAKTGVYMFGTTLETAWTASVTAIEEENTNCNAQASYNPPPPDVVPVCQSLKIIEPTGDWVLNEDNEQDFEVEIQSDPINHVWTVAWEVTNSNDATHFDHGTSTSKINTLINPTPTSFVRIFVPDPADPNKAITDGCEDTKPVETIPTTVSPSIKKHVRNGDLDDDDKNWDDLINIQGQEDDEDGTIPEESKYVTYKITFYPGEGKGVKSAIIQEKSFDDDDGVIKGSQGGELVFHQEEENLIIEVKENGNTKVLSEEDDNDFDICKYDDDGNLENDKACVSLQEYEDFVDNNNDIEFQNLVEAFADDKEGLVFNNLKNVSRIRIYYEMENKTALTKDKCNDLKPETDGCGEKFVNEAYFEAFKKNDPDNGNNPVDEGDDETEVIAICQFIITRSAGDVFFNSPLKAGVDVAFCSEQKNIQGPTIKGILDPEEEITSTGAGDIGGKTFLTTPTHDICKYSNIEGATEGAYDNPLKSFSSTICEMEAEVAEGWQKEYIVNQINTNIWKLTQWHTTGLISTIDGEAPQDTDQNIYSWKDTPVVEINGLEISESKSPLTQTYVVRNGDLNINNDIKYNLDTNILGAFILKRFPSAAFIVIDGNINIHKDVEQLDGVFIAIDTDNEGDDGKINSNEISYKQLTINGILVGDVSDLFENRRFVGDISQDEGSVTIKFSENFLLNTPPGLSELLDLTQLRVAY